MTTMAHFFFFTSSVIFIASIVAADSPIPHSIDCGSAEAATDAFGLRWQVENSTFKDSVNISTSAQDTSSLPSSIPYRSARVFTSRSSYNFSVQGRYWLRLYFYPVPAPAFNLSTANFTISVGAYQLFSGRIVQAIEKSNKSYLVQEFTLDAGDPGAVIIDFTPSPGSFAFINGIQIMQLPDDALKDDAVAVPPLRQDDSFRFQRLGLQTMYRLNVGGSSVNATTDVQARSWIPDDKFIQGTANGTRTDGHVSEIKYSKKTPEYIAPASVYGTARVIGRDSEINISWSLPVDPGFSYFVRLHFAELVYSSTYDRIFNIYINNQTAVDGFDILSSVAEFTPVYKDFEIMVPPDLTSIRIQMGSAPKAAAAHKDAILNGLEVFKMNNTAGFLSGPGTSLESSRSNRSTIRLGAVVGIAVGGLAGLSVSIAIFVLCFRKTRTGKKVLSPTWKSVQAQQGTSVVSIGSPSVGATSSAALHSCRQFTLQQIKDATDDFDHELLLGVGGFGKVYEGVVEGGVKVAIKRGKPGSQQGLKEFLTEIELLSGLRHRHLVSLIGYCDDSSEMILVYECMANGTLREHLYGTGARPLSWKLRLEICIGAARGLHYLHTGATRAIIHRDVKTTNILLDERFVAKVADFGLSKVGPSLEHSHVSTAVKGSFGYLDPEYFRRQRLTEKSDVYSFGVVLMEVLCARPAVNPALPRQQISIAEWAIHWQRLGKLERIMDPSLAGDCTTESLGKFGDIAESCLADKATDRPSMGQVLWNLEYALQLHQASSSSSTFTKEFTPVRSFAAAAAAADGDDSVACTDSSSGAASESALFSQLMNPEGR